TFIRIRSIVEGRNPDGHINAASTSEIDINPYVTSEDLCEIPFVESKSSPPAGKVGPINGDVYTDVKKQPRSAEDTSAIHPTAGNRDKPTKAPKPVK
ncbi:hypothetical protein LSH36_1290g00031, partial [Paralvinella palmiformis]